MKILSKENWWIWLLLMFFSGGSSILVLGALLDVYDKNAWYAKWYIWLIGAILILPFTVMITVLNIDILTKTAYKLEVNGKDYYLSPYIWIILIIIPIIGWILFIALMLYLNIAILINLNRGNGEKYID